MEFEKVKQVIAEQLGVDESAVTMDASFVEDLGADSLDIVELIMGLESEFESNREGDRAAKEADKQLAGGKESFEEAIRATGSELSARTAELISGFTGLSELVNG